MLLDKQKLQILTEEFVNYILNDVAPDKMCFAVCYPLSLHLANNGYENLMKAGLYNNTPHYIITLKNNDNTIIDPTVRQFDIKKPLILFKNLSEVEEYKDFKDFDFEQIWND